MKKRNLFFGLLALSLLSVSACSPTPSSSSSEPSESSQSFSSLTLVSLDVTPPTKVVYEIGEQFDSVGMVVYAVYDDESRFLLTENEYSVSGFDSSISGDKVITVTYQDITATFNVHVNAPVTLSSISVTPPLKTQYGVGEALDTTGITVTALYSNNNEEIIDISNCEISGFDSSTIGTKVVTVTYMDKSDSFEVYIVSNLIEVAVDNITYPEKSYVYDGNEKELLILSDVTGIDVLYENNKLTNAGSVNAKATITAKEGYKLTKNGADLASLELNSVLTITKKDITVTVDDVDYTGDTLIPNVNVDGAVSGDNVDVATTFDREVKDVGHYTGTASTQNDNYSVDGGFEFDVKATGEMGTMAEFDFASEADKRIPSINNCGTYLRIDGEHALDNGKISVTENTTISSTDKLLYMTTPSITVELTAKIGGVYVPTTGEKWFPLVCKDNEYFIGYWTTSEHPGIARLVMSVNSGASGDIYYSTFFDDTNHWLSIDEINNGRFHTYALSYDSASGNATYYYDNALIAKAPSALTRKQNEVRRVEESTLYIGAGFNANSNVTLDRLEISGKAYNINELNVKNNEYSLDYDFNEIIDGVFKDNSTSKIDINAQGLTCENGVGKITSASTVLVEGDSKLNSSALTIEFSAKIENVTIPETGDKWYPLICKDNEYFIGYWVNKAVSSYQARLVFVLNSGSSEDPHYNIYFDDTNCWIDLAYINDGSFHMYGLTYSPITGEANYYLDHVSVAKLAGAPKRNVGDARRVDPLSPIYIGAGWGFNSDVALDYLRISDNALSIPQFTNKGVLAEFDFANVNENNQIEDISLNSNSIQIPAHAVKGTDYEVRDNGVEIITKQDSHIKHSTSLSSASIEIEITATIYDLVIPTSGDNWFPLVAKDFEFFIGFWVNGSDPNVTTRARLCMSLSTKHPGRYDNFWDDTNEWIEVDDINGVEHTYKLSYNALTGVVEYSFDGRVYGSASRTPNVERNICSYNTNIWVGAGFGKNTHVLFSHLSFRG